MTRRRNLIVTGGIRHPFADASLALRSVLAQYDIDSEITEDVEGGFACLRERGYDMVTVYALRWRMLGDEKYAPHRATWAFSLSEHGRDALTRYVRDGGALFGLHTASLCFDDWPGWKDLLGGVWTWGKSFHPPRGPVAAGPTADPHPITAGIAGFEVVDEVYSALDIMPDVKPLMTARMAAPVEGSKSADQPVLWAREFGRGRVIYEALGHDRASIEQAEHRRIIARSALWLLRQSERTVRAV